MEDIMFFPLKTPVKFLMNGGVYFGKIVYAGKDILKITDCYLREFYDDGIFRDIKICEKDEILNIRRKDAQGFIKLNTKKDKIKEEKRKGFKLITCQQK